MDKSEVDELLRIIKAEAEESFNSYWSGIIIEPAGKAGLDMAEDINQAILRITRMAFVSGWQAAIIRMLKK